METIVEKSEKKKQIIIQERFDCLKIEYIKSLSYENFKNIKKQLPEVRGKQHSEDDLLGEYTVLQRFCKSTLEHKGVVNRVYTSVNGARYYGVDSIQGISKIFKGFILEGMSRDADMSNSHPVIMEYLCKTNGIDVPQLTYYNNNRDLVVASNNNAKLDVISYINGNKTPTSDEFLKKFKLECETQIHGKLIKLPKYAHFYENISGNNIIGTVTFRIMENMEVKIMTEIVMPYLTKLNIEICILIHDGLVIYSSHHDTKLLTNVAQMVNNKYPGLNAKFTYKEHANYINNADYQFFLVVERFIVQEFNRAIFSSGTVNKLAKTTKSSANKSNTTKSEDSSMGLLPIEPKSIKVHKVGDELPPPSKPKPKSAKTKSTNTRSSKTTKDKSTKPSMISDKNYSDALFKSLMNS